MSYDNRYRVRYTFPEFDFGNAAVETYVFRAPSGKTGKVRDIGVMTTEVFAVDLTTGSVQLGTASDADAYCLLAMADAIADADCWDTTDDTDAIISADISASTTAAGRLLKLTLTNGTDSGAVSGKGVPFVEIDWF